MLKCFRNCTGKRGTALAELMVTLALLTIVSTMIVSFSAVVNTQVVTEQSQYTFLDEAAQIRDQLSAWLSKMDEEGTAFTVTNDKIAVSSIGASAGFDNGTESLILKDRDGAESRVTMKTVDSVVFTVKKLSDDSAIVKCTVLGSYDVSKMYSQSFVLTLQCGSFAE